MNKNGKTCRSSLLLFLTACIWGLAFVSQSKGMEVMQPFTFNGVRCLLGAAVLFHRGRKRQRNGRREKEKGNQKAKRAQEFRGK